MAIPPGYCATALSAAGQLYLFYHLIGAVVQLLFGGYNPKQVNDKGQLRDADKDKYYRTEIVGFPSVILMIYRHITKIFLISSCVNGLNPKRTEP